MYTNKRYVERKRSLIKTNDVLREGESIEQFLRKALQGGQPIEATAKLTYNDRKDGVLPQHDIRSDRFEMAREATDKIHATKAAARHKQDFGPTPEEIAAEAAAAAATGKTIGEA